MTDKAYLRGLMLILLIGSGVAMCTMTAQEVSIAVFLVGLGVIFLVVALGEDEGVEDEEDY